jgi:hypothetical protein
VNKDGSLENYSPLHAQALTVSDSLNQGIAFS